MSSLLTGRRVVLGLALVAAAIVTTVSLVSLLGSWIWPLDLLSHYRLQYAMVVLLAVVAAGATRSAPVAGGLAVVLALHLVPVAPLVLPASQPEGPGTGLRVVQINVLTRNERVTDTAAWLREQRADVIVAQETNQRWVDGLTAELSGWRRLPTDTVRADNFGIVVFVAADLPVQGFDTHDPASTPAIAVELELADGPPLMIYAIHSLPPIGSAEVDRANEQLDLAAAVLDGHEGPRIVIGDLNSTRWGAAYRRLQSHIDLRDSADGHGLLGTWPSRLWFTGMIGIDHVLVSDEIRVDDRHVGPHLGSDHRAVVVDLTIVSSPG